MSEPVNSNLQSDPPTAPARRSFQFRLRTLFIVTTLTAVILSGLTSPWPGVRDLTAHLLLLVVTTVLLTLAVYSRGRLQAFCVGSLPPMAHHLLDTHGAIHIYASQMAAGDWISLAERTMPILPRGQAWVLVYLALSVVTGLVAIGIRSLLGMDQLGRVEEAVPSMLPQPPRREALHRRLPTLLFAVLVCAPLFIGIAVGPLLPRLLAWEAGITILLVALVTGSVHGQGFLRTFCLGAALAAISNSDGFLGFCTTEWLFGTDIEFDANSSFDSMVNTLATWYVTAIVLGLLAVLVRWLLELSHQDRSA